MHFQYQGFPTDESKGTSGHERARAGVAVAVFLAGLVATADPGAAGVFAGPYYSTRTFVGHAAQLEESRIHIVKVYLVNNFQVAFS